MVREDVRLAPDDGNAVGLRAERPLEPEVLLVGAPELVQKVPQRRLAVSATQDTPVLDRDYASKQGLSGSFENLFRDGVAAV